ncbi:unnamed protein product [Cochlearia groenlandica]
MEILSRLPTKSIARCRCVSKLWASILRREDFTELFLTRSSSVPRLLFAFHTFNDRELLFFSTPQLQENSSSLSLAAASYHMKIPYAIAHERFTTINDFVFLRDFQTLNRRRRQIVSLLCNPSTGESLTLPKVRTRRWLSISSYFGYDPVGKQHKVLSMTALFWSIHTVSEEHQVLTLEDAGKGKKLSWRMVECSLKHSPRNGGICINGVLYYPTSICSSIRDSMIVCFDVRTEKFRFVEHRDGTLINCNGKLGAITTPEGRVVSYTSTVFQLGILQDVEKGEWSDHTYVLSDSLRDRFRFNFVDCVGVTRSNELVLAPHYKIPGQIEPFYIYYYNLDKNTALEIGIPGTEALRDVRVYTSIDYVENVRSITLT